MTAFESGPGNDAALPKDATDREPVKRLVDRAVKQHDRIDGMTVRIAYKTTASVRFLIVRRAYSRASLRGQTRDRQMPAVPDRHEAKAEAHGPSGES